MEITGMIFAAVALAISAGANFWILISIQRRLAAQQKRNADFLEAQKSILAEMQALHAEEKQMHAEQMRSNAALFARYGQVLDAYRRIQFWQNR
ncbi:hypothetical protein [Halomonas sp. N3-2A]|uniref:hypothetical protein n=1 Tax=Halomonas sp. N3-2A TaxID=2014541 RepID=UPI000B5B277D|nr:hypothetical protein [Halomonas sp. N3-2A]ASK18382.1 hypothetical protein CEK60_03255 [Halomonas sp. N3-2A]